MTGSPEPECHATITGHYPPLALRLDQSMDVLHIRSRGKTRQEMLDDISATHYAVTEALNILQALADTDNQPTTDEPYIRRETLGGWAE